MADERLVLQLLEEVLQSGRTPEDVCADKPDLLAEVRARLGRLNRVKGELDALFPELATTGSDSTSSFRLGGDLPQIPGHDVEAVLGRGGMGVVYKARHRQLNRPVAVKMMLAGGFAGPLEVARFRREAETLAGLGHPHIVRVHEAGELDGLPYFTMELVEGGTLAEQLGGVPQPADRAANLVITLAGAVQAAHDRNIVHRDLKPGNILLTPDGTPKVSDFGLARWVDVGATLTRTGARVGTPSYMAPEQAAGAAGAAKPAVDVYALGAILYEVLTGRPPFRAETAAETERQVIAEEPAPPSRLNARVSRDLETICLKCLHKDPRRRYPSAAALADDLGRFRRGETITARPAGAIERTGKWVRRHPGRALLLLIGTLVALALLAGGWWFVARRAATDRAVAADLREAEGALEQSAWPQARAAVDRAKARLDGRGESSLQGRLDRAAGNLELAARLDAIFTDYTGSARTAEEGFDHARANREYATAFREAGFGTVDESPERVAERVRASGIRRAVVGGLDQWANCTHDPGTSQWTLEVARLADPDPDSGWRDRVRDPAVRKNPAVLAELARTAPLDARAVQLHISLAFRLQKAGGDALGLFKRVQAAHPDDFWATYLLACELDLRADPNAIGYYRAALALRPRSFAVLHNLGVALDDQGRVAEATAHRERVVSLDPDNSSAHHNLALSYLHQNRLGAAADEFRTAVRLNPKSGAAHSGLGQALFCQGQFGAARAAIRRSLELLPPGQGIRPGTEWMLTRCDRMSSLEGRLDEIARGVDKPAGAGECVDFAELCARRQQPVAAVRLYVAAFAANPELAGGLGLNRRYYAACAAVRAGCGGGTDAPPDGPARAGLRKQALVWLRADRDQQALNYARGNAGVRRTVMRSLQNWRLDENLSDVRNPEALARLDDDERRQWRALWAGVDGLAAGDSLPVWDSARFYAARREWKLAAESYARVFEVSSTEDGHAWFELAAVQVLAGDRDGYRRTCSHLVEKGIGTGLVRSYHVARACTLAPGAIDDMNRPRERSEAELGRSANDYWSLTEQAALHYRAGRPQEAIPLLLRSLATSGTSGHRMMNWLWLALAHQRLGQTKEAAAWLDKVRGYQEQFEGRMPVGDEKLGFDLHNWLEAQILRQEVEALMRQPLAGK
ncbi:serine/threonine-protein kinase [Fimbriiglobus ruber]|uniref:non-specific serine/threonine protein kinase n=1 Tax=Fimbriiglobus ruber TaxID=1908690 RepID=A0A225DWR1_9BACT|nr:serine/threonine-protein kinase [Fimbriiglobus ruber]OWK45453.1 Serine/threonine protein kinase PrkC, regulator of stationary phase [Fimbriiglobus ruber]